MYMNVSLILLLRKIKEDVKSVHTVTDFSLGTLGVPKMKRIVKLKHDPTLSFGLRIKYGQSRSFWDKQRDKILTV